MIEITFVYSEKEKETIILQYAMVIYNNKQLTL